MSNLLPVSSQRLDRPLALQDLQIEYTTAELYSAFHATDGALIDLSGLEAIAAAPTRVVEGAMVGISPTDSNLVLSGLEVSGSPLIWPVEVRQEDTMQRIEIQARGLIRPEREVEVSEGTAVVRDQLGRPQVLRIDQPLRPENRPPRGEVALVLLAETSASGPSARGTVVPRLRYVPREEARLPHHLPLAISSGQTWATDLQRLLAPEHPIVLNMLTLIEYLEHVVWDADRHGWAWQRRQQGREWSRYQTTATLALQGMRTALMTHPSTTLDRVRLLRTLHFELRRSIEMAEEKLMKWLGQTEGPDPYRAVAPVDLHIRGRGGRPPGGLIQELQAVFSDYILRDQTRTQVSIYLYPPLNAAGRETLEAQFRQLATYQESQHQANEDLPSAADIEVEVQGAATVPLRDVPEVVAQLSAQNGWEPR